MANPFLSERHGTGANPGKVSRRKSGVPRSRRALDDVRIEIIDEQGGAVPYECFDISVVGVYLYADLLLSEGEELIMSLTLPSSPRPVSVRGQVVRSHTGEESDGPGMGVAFRDIGYDVKEQLRKYVARRFLRHAKSGKRSG